MKLTGYQGPYNKTGFPTRFVMDDGTVWREATRQELADAAPDLPVMLSLGREPVPAGKFADLRFPGGYPFLPGFAALRPVYVQDKEAA